MIDDLLVAFDSLFPFGPFDAFAEPLEEDVKQIAEGDERLQAAGFEQRPVELDVKRDPGFEIAGGAELIDELPEARFDSRVGRHLLGDAGEDARFDDHAAFDQLERVGVEQSGMEAEVFGDAAQVEPADGQADARFRFDDPEELERLGRFANAGPADAERFSQLAFGRQSIAGAQMMFDDVLLDLLGGLIADFRTS